MSNITRSIPSGALQAAQLDYFLVDGSASMMSLWTPTQAAMDGFCDTLLSQNMDSFGIVSVFNTRQLQDIQRESTLSTWPRFSDSPLTSQWGGTPLYDAINLMGRHLRDLDPKTASIVIATDGDEQDSRHTSHTQARAILDWCRAKGWLITFLGANFNNEAQAKLLGANPQNLIGVQKGRLAEAGKLLGDKRARHIRTGADIGFSDDEKEIFGGFLTGPSK